MNATVSLSLSDRFVMALEGLYGAVAARFRSGVLTVAMIHLICRRVRRVEGQIQRLMALFRAGALPQRAAVATVAARRQGRMAAAGVAAPGLPRRFGWLLPLVPCEAANFASQLRHVLAEPEMMALLAASAQARRVLAPLCRMLAIEPAVLMPAVLMPVAVTVAVVPEAVAVVPEGAADGERCGGYGPGTVPLAPQCSVFRVGAPAQGPPVMDGSRD